MITRLSESIAKFIRSNNEQAASMEVLMFSIFIFLNALLVTFLVVGVSIFTGHLLEAAAVIVSYVALRFFSGGMHLPTSTICNVFSTVVLLVLAHIPISYWNAGFVIHLIALALIIIYAPTKDIMALNRLGPTYTIHFKIISIALVSLNFAIQSPVISLAFVTQALSLVPWSYKAAALLERR